MASAADLQRWIPDAELVAQLETKIKLPEGARFPLSKYSRYYTGVIINGLSGVLGELVLNDKSKGVHIVDSQDKFPGIVDGGCGIIHLSYDIRSNKITKIECNGLA